MTPEQLNQIADELDNGFKCYLHKNNGSVISIPDELRYPDMEIDSWEGEIKQINSHPSEYIEIEPLDTRESFRIMEDFVDTVSDPAIQTRLAESLQRPKPFQNFRLDIDRCGPYRQKWFDFKKNRTVAWVKEQIEISEL